nr:myosin xviiia [Hymenolepis microstoma]
MAFSDEKCNPSSTMTTQISKEAIQRVHEQIFVHTPRLRFPCPDFSIHHRTPYAVSLDRASYKHYQELYTENNQRNHTLLAKCPTDFSLGILPGDIIVSINDVDIKQLSSEKVKEKFTSDGPNELKLILIPSEGCLELSTRSIYLDDQHLGSLQDFLTINNSNSSHICLRSYIKENGCLKGVSASMKKMYVNILKDIASHSNGLCSVGDIVLITHRDGYSNGALVELLPEDEYQVKLVPGEQILTVNSDDINRANPKELEGVEDLILLPHLNEVSIVYNLHSRFLNSLPYTYVADFALIAFNPLRNLDIYNESIKHLFFNCRDRLDMPPHIYSVAQTIIARIEAEFLVRKERSSTSGINGNSSHVGRDRVSTASMSAVKIPTQAVCLLGRSGSGKSMNAEYLIEYLLTPQSTQSSNSSSQCINEPNLTARKMRAVMCLLDAFTCSRTLLNSNASRCLRLFTIEFMIEREMSIPRISASGLYVDILLLDKFRVTRRPQGEPTFHVFYYFLAGLEKDVRREYMLEDLISPNLFMTPLQRLEDQALARSRWQAVHEAARVLGETFEDAFIHGVCRLLAAIYHLGCAGAIPPQTSPSPVTNLTPVSNSPVTPRIFINRDAAERAARLLGCPSVEHLANEVFSTTGIDDADCASSQPPSNLELLGGFVANLYAIATNTLRDLINIALNPVSGGMLRSNSEVELRERTARVVVVDPPGLQTPEAGGRMSGGSFEDLLYNYTNECLLQLYRDCQSLNDESGNIRCENPDFVDFLDNPPESPLSSQRRVSCISRPSLSRNCDSPFRSVSATFSQSDEDSSVTWTVDKNVSAESAAEAGLLWLLDYACCTGDMKTFLRLIAHKYVNHKTSHVWRDSRLLRRLHRSGAFSLNHWNATAVVQYHPSTWISSCHYSNSPRSTIDLLQRSKLPLLRKIGNSMDEGASASTLSVSSSTGLVEAFILDTKYVVDLLRTCCISDNRADCGIRGDIQWVHCLLPVASAGLWQVAPPTLPTTTEFGCFCVQKPHARFCVALVRAQVHAISLATDLIYLKSAFTQHLMESINPTANESIEIVSSPPHSISEDLVTVTEAADRSTKDTKTPAEVSTVLSQEKSNALNGTSRTSSEFDANMHSDATVNNTTNESADTYNFVFNHTSNTFPWEQLLTLAPVDRALIKQLRFQLEEMEESKELLLRKQRTLTTDLEECQQQLNQEQRERRVAELRCQTAQRENTDLQCRVEELEEELEENSRRQRRAAISNTSASSPSINSYANELYQLIDERNSMREEIANLQERLTTANAEKAGAADMELVYLKAKVNELEGRLELETSTKQRLQSTVERLKSQIDQMASERERLLTAVQYEREKGRQLSRNLREAVEEKERADRRLEEHKRSGSTSNDAVSVCVQEQLRLQQELSHLLLRCKEEELKSVMRRSRQINDASDYGDSDNYNEDMDSETELEDVYTSETNEGDGYKMKIPLNGSVGRSEKAMETNN